MKKHRNFYEIFEKFESICKCQDKKLLILFYRFNIFSTLVLKRFIILNYFHNFFRNL